jgi:hypothetical protein
LRSQWIKPEGAGQQGIGRSRARSTPGCGKLPKVGTAMLHPGEMLIPASLAEQVRREQIY